MGEHSVVYRFIGHYAKWLRPTSSTQMDGEATKGEYRCQK